MTTKRPARLGWLLIFYAIMGMGIVGQTGNARASDLSAADIAAQDARVLSLQPKIKSDDFRVREQAFDALTAPLRKNNGYGSIDPKLAAESTKRAVTELLSYEFGSEPPQSTGQSLAATESDSDAGEDLAGYVPALIQATMELHDPGSIPLLYKPDILTSGSMATDALAYFGKTEPRRVYDLYKNAKDGVYKDSLEMTLFGMLHRRTIDDPVLLNRLEASFMLQATSPRAGVRTYGAIGLSYFSDTKAREKLTYMAAHDPWFYITAIAHKPSFSVRDAAKLALRGPISKGPTE